MFALVLVALIAVAAPESESAERLAAKGFASFQAKDFRLAADFFLRAYSVSGEATALRNAARALEEAKDTDHAIRRWKEYRSLPGISAEDRREAEQHLASLAPPPLFPKTERTEPKIVEPKIVEPKIIEPKIVEQPQPIAEPSSGSIAPWILGGSGGGLLIAGLIVYGVGQSKLSDLEDRLAMVDSKGNVIGIDRDEALQQENTSDNLRTAGAGLAIAGAAVVVTGLIWWVGANW